MMKIFQTGETMHTSVSGPRAEMVK